MRTVLTAIFFVLALAVASVAVSAQYSTLAYPTGCIYRKTLTRYTSSNNYNTSALHLTQVALEQNAPFFLVQGDGSFDVNMFGGQVSVIGLLSNANDLLKLNANSGNNNIAYTAAGIPAGSINVGQIYWVLGNSGTTGSASFAVQVVAQTSSTTTVDVLSFSQVVAGHYSNNCYSVQSSYQPTGRCGSDSMIPVSSACQL